MKTAKSPLPKELTPFVIAKEDFIINRDAKLGSGSTCVVYEGAYRDETVATKLFSLKDSELSAEEQSEYLKQAVCEAKILSEFKSDHILQFRGITYLYQHYALVTEKVSDFREHLKKQTDIALEQQLSWALQITIGLQAVHAKDIIHRDLRLNNILMDSKNQTKLADFGEAVKLPASGELREKSQYAQDFCESQPYHTAPEVGKGYIFSKSSDIYSLGTLFCELLTPKEWLPTVLGDPQKLPSSWPAEFKRIISACWHPNSGLRPSAQEVKAYLEKALQNLRKPVKVKSTPKPAKSVSAMKICTSITKSFSLFAKVSLITPGHVVAQKPHSGYKLTRD
jgi:serine/threonine protein kinase